MVSVCIATYNGEKFIKEQIDSILIQLNKTDEIIVSDDGSTDKTLEIINDLKDNRIKVVYNKGKKGVVGNFNNAITHTKGEYIFLADQDDIWLENKISISKNDLLKYDIVVTNCQVVDVEKNIIHPSYFEITKSGKGFVKNFYKSTYLGCCTSFNKKVKEAILPFPSNLITFHDWWIGFFGETIFTSNFNPTICMNYRRHEETSSQTLGKSHLSLYTKIIYRFQLIYLGIIRLVVLKIKSNK